MYSGTKGRFGAVVAALAVVLLVPTTAEAATADLAVTTTDSPDPVVEGAELTYTVTISNLGPESASGVTLTDELSSQVQFVSASASQGSCDIKGKTVTCELGMLAVGDATVTIKVTPKKAGQLTNSASVAIAQGDDDPGSANNTDTETTTVNAAGGGGGGAGGATCGGRAATQVGTGGPDTLVGTPGGDVIKAKAGNDVIRGLQGNDIVCAGGGKDTLKGAAGNDRLKGGAGRDLLRGAGGSDDLLGGPGRDVCKGGPGRDTERSC